MRLLLCLSDCNSEVWYCDSFLNVVPMALWLLLTRVAAVVLFIEHLTRVLHEHCENALKLLSDRWFS